MDSNGSFESQPQWLFDSIADHQNNFGFDIQEPSSFWERPSTSDVLRIYDKMDDSMTQASVNYLNTTSSTAFEQSLPIRHRDITCVLQPPLAAHASQIETQALVSNMSSFSVNIRQNQKSNDHTHEEWLNRQEEIRQLYVKKDKPLKEVIDIMASRGFHATKMMYKKRLTKWGFFKNMRKADAEIIAKVQMSRSRIGKRSKVIRNGYVVDLDNYMRRKGIKARDLLESCKSDALPSHLVCRTPSPSPQDAISRFGIKGPDVLMTRLHDRGIAEKESNVRAIFFGLFLAREMFQDGDVEAGGHFMRACFSSLHLVFWEANTTESMLLLVATTYLMDLEIACEVWRYLAAYSAIVLGKSHRIHNILELLFQLHSNGDILAVLETIGFSVTEQDAMKPSDEMTDIQAFGGRIKEAHQRLNDLALENEVGIPEKPEFAVFLSLFSDCFGHVEDVGEVAREFIDEVEATEDLYDELKANYVPRPDSLVDYLAGRSPSNWHELAQYYLYFEKAYGFMDSG